MPQLNRFIAAILTLAIITVVIAFAFGRYTTVLDTLFSFSLQSLAVKSALAMGLLIIAFFGRPRTQFHRTLLGIIVTITAGFSAYGAFTGTLLFGDALLLIIGTLITATEATEGKTARQHSSSTRYTHE